LQDVVGCSEINAGGGINLAVEVRNARIPFPLVAVAVQRTFQMGGTIRCHAPDIAVALTAPEEGQDREPKHDVAERGVSHKSKQELFDKLLVL
jgi:hypothetical protein